MTFKRGELTMNQREAMEAELLTCQRKDRAISAVSIAKHAQAKYREFEKLQRDSYAMIADAVDRMVALAEELTDDRAQILDLMGADPGGPGMLLGELQRAEVDLEPVRVRWLGTRSHTMLDRGGYDPPPLGPHAHVLWQACHAILEQKARVRAHEAEIRWIRAHTIG
jgi:hypothetical protein